MHGGRTAAVTFAGKLIMATNVDIFDQNGALRKRGGARVSSPPRGAHYVRGAGATRRAAMTRRGTLGGKIPGVGGHTMWVATRCGLIRRWQIDFLRQLKRQGSARKFRRQPLSARAAPARCHASL